CRPLLIDPPHDVRPLVPDVSADLSDLWPGALVVPLIDRLDRYADVIGEILGRSQLLRHSCCLPADSAVTSAMSDNDREPKGTNRRTARSARKPARCTGAHT